MASWIRWLASVAVLGCGCLAAAAIAGSGCRSAPPPRPSAGGSICPGAGSGAIQGVVEGRGGRKMRGVVVLAHAASASGTWSATSDSGGAYKLCVPAGEYVVQFVAEGVEAAQVSGVTVREANATALYRRLGDTQSPSKPVVPNCSDVTTGLAPVGCFP